MHKYIGQRLLLAIPTLVGVTIVLFLLIRVVTPTDVVDMMVGEYGRNDPALAERLRAEFGLTGSLPSQYLSWFGNTIRGEFGKSLYSGRSVAGEMLSRVPVSIELGLIALTLHVLVGVPLGILSAVKQDQWGDYLARGAAITLHAMPGFWIAVLAITFGSITFNWAPPTKFAYLMDDPLGNLKSIFLPALIMGIAPSAGMVRLVRTQMLEVLRQDYIRTAQAKGLNFRTVLVRHALRNALIPVVTSIGLTFPLLMTGTVIYEQIFMLPGMGRYLVEGIRAMDYPVVQTANVLFGVTFILCNLIVDCSYAFFDPRIRYA